MSSKYQLTFYAVHGVIPRNIELFVAIYLNNKIQIIKLIS
jgi:hypothetical protein